MMKKLWIIVWILCGFTLEAAAPQRSLQDIFREQVEKAQGGITGEKLTPPSSDGESDVESEAEEGERASAEEWGIEEEIKTPPIDVRYEPPVRSILPVERELTIKERAAELAKKDRFAKPTTSTRPVLPTNITPPPPVPMPAPPEPVRDVPAPPLPSVQEEEIPATTTTTRTEEETEEVPPPPPEESEEKPAPPPEPPKQEEPIEEAQEKESMFARLRDRLTDYELKAYLDEFKKNISQSASIEFEKISLINILINKILSYIPSKSFMPDEHLIFTFKKFGDFQPELGYGFTIVGSIAYKGDEITAYLTVARPIPSAKKGIKKSTQEGPQENERGAVEESAEEVAQHSTEEKPEIGMSLRLDFPKSWKIGDNYPALKKLNEFALLSPTIIFSSFKAPYFDPELRTLVSRGMNFISRIALIGPLEVLGQFTKFIAPFQKDKTAYAKLKGTIAPNPLNSQFEISVPVRFGVDFEQLYKAGKLPFQIPVITGIATSDITVKVDLGSAKLVIKSGFDVGLTTQPTPLQFGGGFGYAKGVYSFFGAMDSTWTNAFGLHGFTLSNLGAEIESDPAVTLVIACPVTGVGLRGRTILGSGSNAVSIDVAGKVSLQATALPKFVLSGRVNQINIGAFIELLAKLLSTTITTGDIPIINFSDLEFTVIPVRTYIADKMYGQGFKASGRMNIAGFQGGGELSISNEEKRISGIGYLSPIRTPILNLTGKGEDGGPVVFFDISPFKHEIFMSVNATIPLLLDIGLSGDFVLDRNGMSAEFTTKLLEHIRATFKMRMPFTDFIKRFDDLLIRYEIMMDLTLIKEELAKSRADMKKEIDEKRAYYLVRIKTLEDKLQETGELCKKSWFTNVSACFSSVKSWLQKNITSARRHLAFVERKLRSGYYITVSKIVDIASSIEIREISGEITGKDLKQAKSPHIRAQINIDVPGYKSSHILDLQFDFKHPAESAKNIVKSIQTFLQIETRTKSDEELLLEEARQIIFDQSIGQSPVALGL